MRGGRGPPAPLGAQQHPGGPLQLGQRQRHLAPLGAHPHRQLLQEQGQEREQQEPRPSHRGGAGRAGASRAYVSCCGSSTTRLPQGRVCVCVCVLGSPSHDE